jgi:CheY-like chemotaxis protein
MGGSADGAKPGRRGLGLHAAAARSGPDAARRRSALPTRRTAPYRQRLVHYVEDNETNIEVMRGVLAQRAADRPASSLLGLDGLVAMRQQPPDLILLDMHLPDISGLELLRHIKQDDQTLADIAGGRGLGRRHARPHVEEALTLGAQHYVTKPLDVTHFLAIVDQVLEGTETRL